MKGTERQHCVDETEELGSHGGGMVDCLCVV